MADDPPVRDRWSRRGVLAGGLAGAGALALAACREEPATTTTPATPRLTAAHAARVPGDDPRHRLWDSAPPLSVELDSQVLVLPFRAVPSVPTITVRALNDGHDIAFRIDWADRAGDDLTVGTAHFRDACAVLLAPGRGEQAARIMGQAQRAATILHWKADWQRDVDRGFEDVRDVFPNMSVDFYPPLVDRGTTPGRATKVDVETYRAAKALMWVPAVYAGNPVARPGRTSPVEKAAATGPGSLTTLATQNARGRGVRTADGWSVVLTKPLAQRDRDEVRLWAGGVFTCAFAIWAGSDADVGGRKSPSKSAYELFVQR